MSVITDKSQISRLPESSGPKSQHWLADLSELVKARLSLLVLITTLVGFLFGWRGDLNLLYLFHTLCGTALAAAGAAALNEVFEVELDARMQRTRNRPLPGGRMTLEEGLIIGVVCSVAGILWLSFATNLYAGVLSALTVGIYLFVYTPLKQITTLNTIVGAVPGALPPMIGWVAARGHIDFECWILFAILFMWQMPHFLAISWLYRNEYKEAGFVMLSSNDPECRVTGRQGLLYTMGLISVSLIPAMLELTNIWYLPIATIMGGYFFWKSLQFALRGTQQAARALFIASIIYLPVTLAALVFTRT